MMTNEVRLIDANALIERLREAEAHKGMGAAIAGLLIRYIGKMPTIDPESLRPKGRWEKHWCENDLIGHMYEVCPNCRSCEMLDTDKFWDSNYCPNCGADMREG